MESESAPRRSFRPHPVVFSIGALLAASMVAMSLSGNPALASQPMAYKIGHCAGLFTAILLVPLLISYVVFLLARRSNIVATCVLAITCGLLFTINVMGLRSARNAAAMAALADSSADLNSLRTPDGGFDAAEAAKVSQKALKNMETAAQASEGGQKTLLEAGIRLSKMLQEANGRYNATVQAFLQPGALAPETLKTAEAIDARSKLLEAASSANDELISLMKNAGAKLDEDLKAHGVSESQRRIAARDFNAGFQKSLGNTPAIRDCDTRVFAAWRKQLELLRLHLGHWSMEDDTIVFDKGLTEAVAEFSRCAQVIADETKRQDELFKAPAK